MSNRIDQCFVSLKQQSRKALIPFITVGDPHPDWTSGIMQELVEAGADVLDWVCRFPIPWPMGLSYKRPVTGR